MPEELSRELLERLARLRSRREWQRMRTGFFRTLGVLVLIATSALAVEAVFHLSITGRTVLFWSTVGLMASSVIMLFLPAVFEKTGIRPRLTNEDLAERIGEHFTEVEDKLVNVLQLNYSFASQPAGSGAFAQAAFATTYGSVRHLDFNAILDNRPVRRSMLFFIFALIIGGGSFFASGSELMAAGERLVNYDKFYQKPAPFELIVEPGNGKLLRGTTVKFTVRTRGEQLKNLTLNMREEGTKEFDKIELRGVLIGNSNETQFVYEVRIQRPMEYFAEAREIVSDKYSIAVLDKPLVRSLSVVVAPPSYTREAPRALDENLGDVTGIVGTRIQVAAQSSKELLAARLVFNPFVGTADTNARQPRPEVYNLHVNGSLANGSVAFRRSGLYHIELLDTDSLWSEKPIEYTVTLSEDEMPAVALLDPGERADLPGNLRLPMLVRIHDDFGFSKLRLGYRITKSKFVPEEKEYKWLDLPLADYHTQDLEVPYIWNLAKLDITPEDELGYVLELADNDMVSGPKKVRTSEFAVRFPSVDEIFKKAEEEHAQSERSLQEIKQDAEDLKHKIDETVSEIRQTTNSDVGKKQQEFSVRKDAEDIMKRQSELENRVSDVKNRLDQMTKNLEQQNAISEQTLQKYAELQKLLEEVKTPELEAAFDKLKQAMKNMDPRAMEQAMKDVQFNEDQFKAAIERTSNLLKKIKLEQKLDELTKRSDELAKNQEQTSKDQQESANKQQSPQDKAAAEQKQKDALNELARMQEEAREMAKDMQKLPEKMQAPEEMKDAAEAVNDPSIEQAMEDAQEAMKQSKSQRASQRSKDAAQKLKQARNKLEELKQKMAESEKERNLAELKKMRDEMNRLSKEEEKLKQKSKEAMPNSNVFRDFAREQSERKEELGQLASEMMQLAQKTPSVTPQMGREMGKAFNNMQQAQEAMTERDQQNSVSNSQGAMAALNRASQETQKAMDAMQQQGNGSCPNPGGSNPSGEGEPNQPGSGGSAMQQFLDQINSFAEKQQQLNQQLQQMMNGQGQGGQRQMLEQQAAAARMQAGQQALQKSIEDLAKEQQEAGQGKKKAVDELKKIAEEMQDLVSNMRTQGVKQETIQRQERILSRLLEAQRSVNERDKEETREATAGENMARVSPSDLKLTPEERRNLLREEALRARDAGYTRDYQQLIRKYLEQLEK